MGVRRWVAAVLCVPLLGMAGCSDDDPKAEPEDQETPSASTSPTPSGPSIPPEAQGTDEASAKAFVRHWFAVLSDAMVTGNVDDLRQLGRTCVSCNNLADKIEEVYRDGGSYRTEGWQVEAFVPTASSTPARPEYNIRTRHTKRDLIGEAGRVVDTEPAALVAMRVAIIRTRQNWQVAKLEAFQ